MAGGRFPVAAAARSLARALVPRPIRFGISRTLGELTSAGALRELARANRSGRPVVLGPWLGEVGFELLYWIPFIRWFTSRFQIPPSRLIAVSRGGAEPWYQRLASRYCDVYDYLTPAEFAERNARRQAHVGEQKQVVATELEGEILAAVTDALQDRRVETLQPALMYRVLRPFWWGHAPIEWVHRHARYETLLRPASDGLLLELPLEYVAAKFYYNDAFPATAGNRAFVRRTINRLGEELPVVSLATGLRLDDHRACDEEEEATARGIRGVVAPRTNLAVQSAIVAGARSFVGTYGGFAYLAPFYGVPSTAFYSHAGGFSRRHLEVAWSAFATLGSGSALEVRDVNPPWTSSPPH